MIQNPKSWLMSAFVGIVGATASNYYYNEEPNNETKIASSPTKHNQQQEPTK